MIAYGLFSNGLVHFEWTTGLFHSESIDVSLVLDRGLLGRLKPTLDYFEHGAFMVISDY